jgi:hypothetical protein
MPDQTETQYTQRRRSRRAKIAKPLRVRPSEPRDEHFEDLPISINASKEGIYFHTRRNTYYKGMRVFVTFPFTSGHDPMNCEYVAEVVRVEALANGRFGVRVRRLGPSPAPDINCFDSPQLKFELQGATLLVYLDFLMAFRAHRHHHHHGLSPRPSRSV